ncbi:MAG: lysophospholipid acyltransferase family protein [Bacilli bacterium]
MKKYDYTNLKGDEQVTHNWAPLSFEIKNNYNYVLNNPLFKLISNILSLPVFIILYIIDKIFLGFCVINKDKIVKDKGFVSISNHIHYLDCTLIGLIYYPNRVHYPTIEKNFKIPFVRKLIRLLYAMPIPKDRIKKDRFYSQINIAFKGKFILHMYPEAAMWPYYEKIRDFKYGAFKIAVDANVCVQPIKFVFTKSNGLYRLYKKKKRICAVVLDPLYPNMKLEYRDRIKDLRDRTYESMKKEV